MKQSNVTQRAIFDRTVTERVNAASNVHDSGGPRTGGFPVGHRLRGHGQATRYRATA